MSSFTARATGVDAGALSPDSCQRPTPVPIAKAMNDPTITRMSPLPIMTAPLLANLRRWYERRDEKPMNAAQNDSSRAS
jgi:hypothetical protein